MDNVRGPPILGGIDLSGFGGLAFQAILQSINSSNPPQLIMVGLESLSEQLLSLREETALLLPREALAKELIELLNHDYPDFPDIPVKAARAINQLLELLHNFVSVLVGAGIVEALSARFADMSYIDVVEQTVNVLEKVAREYPEEVLESSAPLTLLQFIDFFNMHVQKSTLSVIEICCAAVSAQNMDRAKALAPVLISHLDGGDDRLAELALGAVSQLVHAIAKRSPQPAIDLEQVGAVNLWPRFLSAANADTALLPKVLRALADIAHHRNEVAFELLEQRATTSLSNTLTKTRVSDVQSQATATHTLLHRSRDTLVNATRLFGVLLPVPVSEFGFYGPFRRPPDSLQDADKYMKRIDPAALEEYANVAGRTSILIYDASAHIAVRQMVLLVLLQIAQRCTVDMLQRVAAQIDLVAFASNVLTQADDDTLFVGGLDLIYEMVSKAPAVYLSGFGRQGVPLELERHSSQDGLPLKSAYSFTSDLTAVKMFMVSRILAIYRTSHTVEDNDMSAAHELLSRLRHDASDVASWSQVAALVRDSTTVELLNLGVFQAIADVLSTPANVPNFLKAFDGEPAVTLIGKLNEAVSRSERFNLLSSTDGGVPSMLLAFVKNVRVRLREKGSSRSWPLKIIGIADIETLQQFCLSRLSINQLLDSDENTFSALARQLGRQGGHLDGRDDDEDEDDDQEEEMDMDEFGDLDEDEQYLSWETDGEQPTWDGRYDESGSEQESLNEAMGENTSEDVEDEEPEASGPAPARHSESISPAAELVGVEGGEGDSPAAGETAGSIVNEQAEEEKLAVRLYLNGTLLHPDMTVIGALYRSLPNTEGDRVIPQSLWNDEFVITFEKADTPAPPSNELRYEKGLDTLKTMPASFGDNAFMKDALRLLSTLFFLNETEQFVELSAFINSKLTAKLNRQMEDPLIVASFIMPAWVINSVHLYPFLYPFESRYVFLQSTSFGYSRAMMRWRKYEEEIGHSMYFGQMSKYKYRVNRGNLLTSALKVLEMSSGVTSLVEIEFAGEEGTGLGPTLEFFANVSKEFQKESTGMWRHATVIDGYVHDARGLFPAALDHEDQKVLKLFHGMGKFIARGILDQRIMDFRLNPVFFAVVLGMPIDVETAFAQVDPELAQSLSRLKPDEVEGLDLNFVLPGSEVEMLPGGSLKAVEKKNFDDYVSLVRLWTVKLGIERQVEAFSKGFSEVLPFEALHAFIPEELTTLIGRSKEDWSRATLTDAIKADHGYSLSSQPVQDMLEIMSRFSETERRRFLQFMTGSPNLPIGGFKSLSPPFTIVSKKPDDDADKDRYLPSVMTCANYLKLPEYSNLETMKRQLWRAIDGGSGAFPLS